jgi:hypothetical protein
MHVVVIVGSTYGPTLTAGLLGQYCARFLPASELVWLTTSVRLQRSGINSFGCYSRLARVCRLELTIRRTPATHERIACT